MIAELTHRNGCGGANLGSKYPNVPTLCRGSLENMEGRLVSFSAGTRCHYLHGSREMTQLCCLPESYTLKLRL